MKETPATTLLHDIERLIDAHSNLIEAKRLLAEIPTAHADLDSSPNFAAWLYCNGLRSKERVFAFIKKAFDECKGDRRNFWSSFLGGPEDDDPIPEADRWLNRIDMAMGLVAQATQTAKPVNSVQECAGRDQGQHLKKILAFAQAATDLEALTVINDDLP